MSNRNETAERASPLHLNYPQVVINVLTRQMAVLSLYESKPQLSPEEQASRKDKVEPLKAKITQVSKQIHEWNSLDEGEKASLLETADAVMNEAGELVVVAVAEGRSE